MNRVKSPAVMFLGLSAITEAIYLLVFARPFPLAQLFQTIPPVDYTKLTGYSSAGLIAFVLGVVGLFWVYGYLLNRPLPKFAPYAGLLFAATLFFSYPVLAIDLFIYALRTRGWALYGLNPLAASPADLPLGDPWRNLAAEWRNAPSPYGPVWEGLSLGTFHLAGGSYLVHLFLLKGLAIAAYAVSIFLLGKILAQTNPTWRTTGMVAFAWNPLVLFETAQNGHNDIVMVALLLAAVWAMLNRRAGWTVLALALSVLVKLMTVLAAPFLLGWLAWQKPTWRGRMVSFGAYLLGFAALSILPMWPLWPGWDSWAVVQASHGAGRSVLALLIIALENGIPLSTAFDVGRAVVNGSLLAALGWALWVHRHRLSRPSTALALGWLAMFWYALVVAPVFHAWYLLWSLPLAVTLGKSHPAFRASLIASLTALLVIPYYETVRVWQPVLLENALLGHLIGVSLAVVPPLVSLIDAHRAQNGP